MKHFINGDRPAQVHLDALGHALSHWSQDTNMRAVHTRTQTHRASGEPTERTDGSHCRVFGWEYFAARVTTISFRHLNYTDLCDDYAQAVWARYFSTSSLSFSCEPEISSGAIQTRADDDGPRRDNHVPREERNAPEIRLFRSPSEGDVDVDIWFVPRIAMPGGLMQR